jgi:uncharacterized protein HemX
MRQDENDLDWETVTIALGFGMGVLVLVTILIVVVVREVGHNRRAREAIAREQEYKKLSERYDTFTASTATQLERHATDMSEVRRRLAEVEELLRSVE